MERRSRIPAIPPELWGLIINHACSLHYNPLDVPDDPSFLNLHSRPLQCDTYRQDMRIKTMISLVNKQWNALARPSLYDFVWISKAAQATVLARTLRTERQIHGPRIYSGTLIHRLHIDTPLAARCSPADIRTILEFAPSLQCYSDHHSIHRSICNHPMGLSTTPEEILKLIVHPGLRWLSWTSYGDVPFSQSIAPVIRSYAGAVNLEYLELMACPPISQAPMTIPSDPHGHRASLPALKHLTISLDDHTLTILAAWDMPLLTNLCILSPDLSQVGHGYNTFFVVHGPKLVQLEFGHSFSPDDEYHLTTPHQLPQANPHSISPISLADCCPNLKEVIYSIDPVWHWEGSTWIPPHTLLPFHPNVELVGIRNIDDYLRGDLSLEHAGGFHFFPLFEQFVSFITRDVFPNLRFVRDLSAESQRTRRHAAHVLTHPPGISSQPISPLSFSFQNAPHAYRILCFWLYVVVYCQERGIWCEDYTGVNVTLRSLVRHFVA